MLYIVKWAGRDPANYETDGGWKQYAQDGLCEYILDGITGEVIYRREHFYVIVDAGEAKNDAPRVFDSFDKAYRWAMHNSRITVFRISTTYPDEKGGE